MVAYTNIMELLVESEVELQLSLLPPQIQQLTDPKDLVTFALNRLPPLYARTAEGLEHQIKRGRSKFRFQIAQAVRMALIAVQQEPLRERLVLESLQNHRTRQQTFAKLQLLLRDDSFLAIALERTLLRTNDGNTTKPSVANALLRPSLNKPLPKTKRLRKTHEHMNWLKQGGPAWNHWRAEHPEIKPNFSGFDLSGFDLRSADLSRADLIGTQLVGACLKSVNLNQAYLRNVNLSEACLSEANLENAGLSQACLAQADLQGAVLKGAYLSGANLSGANLSRANLSGADLSGADLSGANLSSADLSNTNLNRANFQQSNLSDAILTFARAKWANLSNADLSNVRAQNTNFTGATFTGACLHNWSTDSSTSFDWAFCDYIRIGRSKQTRYPAKENFPLGEFARLFKRSRLLSG